MASAVSERFLAFSYKPRSGTSNTRVALWRALKDLGAVYLQQGVALLPSSGEARARLEELKARVAREGGSATLAVMHFPDEEDEASIVAEFNRARAEEYGELAQNCRSLVSELERDEAGGEYGFAELEEGAAELAKLRRWLERIELRDRFGGKGRAGADAALKKAGRRLSAYEKAAFAREKHRTKGKQG